MPPIRLADGRAGFVQQICGPHDAPGGGVFATPADAAKAGAITWNYGNFMTLVINFIIVAFCIFLLVRAINNMRQTGRGAPVSKECPFCPMTIPIKATRCPHCTSEMSSGARV